MTLEQVCSDTAEAFKEAWDNEDIRAAIKLGPAMYGAVIRAFLASVAVSEFLRRQD